MSVINRRRWLVTAGGAALLAACKDIVNRPSNDTTGSNGASGTTGATRTIVSSGTCTTADWACLLQRLDEGINFQLQINPSPLLKLTDVHKYVEAAYKPRFDWVTDQGNPYPPVIDWLLLGLHAERLGAICAAVFWWEKNNPKLFFLKPDANRAFEQAHFDLSRDMLGYWLNPHITDRGPHFGNQPNQPQAPSIAGREGDTACPLCP